MANTLRVLLHTLNDPLLTLQRLEAINVHAVIGDSIGCQQANARDLAKLVHIALTALKVRAKLLECNSNVALRERLLALAYRCIDRADWVGPFDETNTEWLD